jgi:hypothetical protein
LIDLSDKSRIVQQRHVIHGRRLRPSENGTGPLRCVLRSRLYPRRRRRCRRCIVHHSCGGRSGFALPRQHDAGRGTPPRSAPLQLPFRIRCFDRLLARWPRRHLFLLSSSFRLCWSFQSWS